MNHIKMSLLTIILGSFCLCIFAQTKSSRQQNLAEPEPPAYPVNCGDLQNPSQDGESHLKSGLRAIRFKPFGQRAVFRELVGPKGLPGKPGLPGLPGRKGHVGERGKDVLAVSPAPPGTRCKCVKGQRGSIGTKGAKGLPGWNGEKGLSGQVGHRGIAGDPGLPGPPASPLTKHHPNDPGMMYVLFDHDGNLPRVVCHHFRRQVYGKELG